MCLMPAQFVKPYRKTNKNDFIEAEAIAKAVTKHNMRFAQVKTRDQLDIQAMHRVRDQLVQRRTALINEIPGFLLERGLTFPARPIHLRKNLPAVMEDAEQDLSPRLRWLLDVDKKDACLVVVSLRFKTGIVRVTENGLDYRPHGSMINAANTTMRKCRDHGGGLFVPPD